MFFRSNDSISFRTRITIHIVDDTFEYIKETANSNFYILHTLSYRENDYLNFVPSSYVSNNFLYYLFIFWVKEKYIQLLTDNEILLSIVIIPVVVPIQMTPMLLRFVFILGSKDKCNRVRAIEQTMHSFDWQEKVHFIEWLVETDNTAWFIDIYFGQI